MTIRLSTHWLHNNSRRKNIKTSFFQQSKLSKEKLKNEKGESWLNGLGNLDTFDAPLKKNDPLPSYVQPNKENDSWQTEWRDLEEEKESKNLQKELEHKENRVKFFSENYAYNVPYRFKIHIPQGKNAKEGNVKEEYSRDVSKKLTYTDFCEFRSPTLSTFDNYRYWQDTGFKKFLNRTFPIKLPEHRKLDPLLREYLYFLHSFDPYRFTFKRLSERYYIPEKVIETVYKEESVKRFLSENQLCDDRTKRITRKEAILKIKELIYSKKIGYKEFGDIEDVHNKEDEFVGYKNTFDQIKRQVVEVESISAFPLPSRRDPVPKRVDIDMTVHNSANVKVINWINPNDKVVF